jgi:LCP family protein required for cell wall assembly
MAATLSFLLPGLGQVWAGSVRRGILLATPAVVFAAIALAALVSIPDTATLAGLALQPDVLIGVLVIDAFILLYRAGAIIDAWRVARRSSAAPARRGVRMLAAAVAGILLGTTLTMHGAVAWVDLSLYEDVTAAFTLGQGAEALPDPEDLPPLDEEALPPAPDETPEPASSMPAAGTPPAGTPAVGWYDNEPDVLPTAALTSTPGPTAIPTPTVRPLPGWAGDGRLNLLLVGGDAGPDRWSTRTDTLILVSVDVATGRAAMFGIPRNLRNVPLPDESAGAFECGCFPGMINALYVYAMGHPDDFPGGSSRGYRAVAGAVQELTGVRLDGMAVVVLAGFVTLVDALGGLTIDVPERLYDRNYPLEDGSGHIVVDIAPGRHHFDGRMALAYARSRHQDSDYGRMGRQQQVLVALRSQLRPCRLVPQIPALLGAAKGTLWTNIRVGDLPEILALAQHVLADRIVKRAFTPPRYHEGLDDPQIAQIRGEVRLVFGEPEPPPAPEEVDLEC